jgi:hypothetical protein
MPSEDVTLLAPSSCCPFPGEAKGELKKCLERNKLGGHIVGIETIDRMTDRQIAAKVRRYFKENRDKKGT